MCDSDRLILAESSTAGDCNWRLCRPFYLVSETIDSLFTRFLYSSNGNYVQKILAFSRGNQHELKTADLLEKP
jgi:hypothetical protein